MLLFKKKSVELKIILWNSKLCELKKKEERWGHGTGTRKYALCSRVYVVSCTWSSSIEILLYMYMYIFTKLPLNKVEIFSIYTYTYRGFYLEVLQCLVIYLYPISIQVSYKIFDLIMPLKKTLFLI